MPVNPDAFDVALAAGADELTDVKIRGCMSVRPRAVLAADPAHECFHFFNWYTTDEYPLTGSGKVQKFILVEQIGKGALQPIAG